MVLVLMIVGTWRIPVVAMLLIAIVMRWMMEISGIMRGRIIIVRAVGIIIKIRIMLGTGIAIVVIVIIGRTIIVMRGSRIVIMIGAIILVMRWVVVLVNIVTIIVCGAGIFVTGRRVKFMTIMVLVIRILVARIRIHVLFMIRVFVLAVGVFMLTVGVFVFTVMVLLLTIFLITVMGGIGIGIARGPWETRHAITPGGTRRAGIALRTGRTGRADAALFTLSQVSYSRAGTTLRTWRWRRWRWR
jgi:hypothetical protein